MKFYSAKYVNTPHNFTIQNLKDSDDVGNKYYKSVCVLKNILQRGSITPISEYLRVKYPDYRPTESPIYYIDNESVDWKIRIKGYDKKGYYPARFFYKTGFARCLPEYAFLLPLMLPEAPISMIIPGQDRYVDQSVDFYLPQAKLVIEIDGEQHQTNAAQHALDLQRDTDLTNAGCFVVRISVREIKSGLSSESSEIKLIKRVLDDSKQVQNMRSVWDSGIKNQDGYWVGAELQEIMAYQILLTELLLNGSLSLDCESWNIDLLQGDDDLFLLAFEDLMVWLKNLLALRNISFEKPAIVFSDNASIKIDYSYKQRWTDLLPQEKDTIYIRLDYWDTVDYFKVQTATSPIDDYDLPEPLNETLSDSFRFLLLNLFGYLEFNDGQLPIILSLLRRVDTIGVLPTGSGKSLCYQFACLLQPSINFVVCPTVSLIQDQKHNLDEFGINHTASISSDLSAEERQRVLDTFSQKRYLMIWISPERFQIQSFRDAIGHIDSNLFSYAIIDEVHCLSEWGHDFRISYLTLIKTIRRYCSEVTLCGLTATVSQFVLRDIKKEFMDEDGHEPLVKATGSMERRELSFYVDQTTEAGRYGLLREKLDQTLASYNDQPSGIVFTMTVNGRNNGCNLVQRNISRDYQYYKSDKYNGQMSPSARVLAQDLFMHNETKCLVATKAFGMGVNKKNIRYTMHYGMPGSLEALYQEAGRAGRDRKPADCYVFFDPGHNSPTIIEKIFDRKTTAEEIARIARDNQISGDLNTIFYFWRTSNLGVEAEVESARKLIAQLDANTTVKQVHCYRELNSDQLEKALYHFYLLGFVKDWTQETFIQGHEQYTVYYENQPRSKWESNLLAYIRKYDPEFLVEPINREDEYVQEYKELLQEEKYVRLLITWLYDNIIYSRREMTKNVYDYCLEYRDSASFKAKIDAYLRVSSDLADTMENIAGSPNDYMQWFNAFYETQNHLNRLNVVKRNPEEIFRTSQRFTESYRNNTGINFVYAVSGMMAESSSNLERKEIQERFTEVMDWLSEKPNDVREYVIRETQKLLESAQLLSIEIFTSVVLSRFPEFAQEMYEKWGDDISLKYVIKKVSEDVHSVVGGFKW